MAGQVGSSQFSVFLVDGYSMLAASVQGVTHEVGVELQRTDGLGSEWPVHTPTGMRNAALSQDDAFFNDETNNIHDAWNTPTKQETRRVACFAVAGNTIGKPFTGLQGVFGLKYGVIGKLGLLTNANVEYAVHGQVDDGVILQSHTAKTIDWNTKTDGAQVDYALDSGQRVFQITSASKAAASIVTTPVPHGLTTGQIILPSNNTLAAPSINSRLAVTVLSTTTFSVPVNTAGSTGAGTGGTFVLCSTVNGGVGYQHVSAFSGITGFVGTIQDSPDDTTYATLVAFANVTSAPTAERVTVAGTVDEYLAFDGNVTGTGGLTPFVGFKRNATA